MPFNLLCQVLPVRLQKLKGTGNSSWVTQPDTAGTTVDTQDYRLGWEGFSGICLAPGSFVQGSFLPRVPTPPRPAA